MLIIKGRGIGGEGDKEIVYQGSCVCELFGNHPVLVDTSMRLKLTEVYTHDKIE